MNRKVLHFNPITLSTIKHRYMLTDRVLFFQNSKNVLLLRFLFLINSQPYSPMDLADKGHFGVLEVTKSSIHP